jgi:hypothetical protein
LLAGSVFAIASSVTDLGYFFGLRFDPDHNAQVSQIKFCNLTLFTLFWSARFTRSM